MTLGHGPIFATQKKTIAGTHFAPATLMKFGLRSPLTVFKAVPSILVAVVGACGTSADTSSGVGAATGPDGGHSLEASVSKTINVVGIACQQESDCLGAGDCGFAIAQGCRATGLCIAKPDPYVAEPGCIEERCGCDGGVAEVPCYWSGDLAYATAPVNPDSAACVPAADAAAHDSGADAAD